MTIDFNSAAEELPAEGIALVALRAQQLRIAQSAAEHLTSDLKAANELVRRIEEVDLPDAMAAIGMQKFVLTTGETVDVKTEYHASIPKAREGEAFNWLREHNADALLKRIVSVQFGRGEDDAAGEIAAMLENEYSLPVEQKLSVHPSTLKSFVKERIEEGAELPQDLFGVHIINRARVVRK